MPVIRIMDMDGNVVFEGEGDIELNSDPDPSAPARARIVQTEPRPEGSVHRAMEVQGGVDGLGPMSFEMEFAALPFLLDPSAETRRPWPTWGGS